MPVRKYIGNKNAQNATAILRVRDASGVVRDVRQGETVDLDEATLASLATIFNFAADLSAPSATPVYSTVRVAAAPEHGEVPVWDATKGDWIPGNAAAPLVESLWGFGHSLLEGGASAGPDTSYIARVAQKLGANAQLADRGGARVAKPGTLHSGLWTANVGEGGFPHVLQHLNPGKPSHDGAGNGSPFLARYEAVILHYSTNDVAQMGRNNMLSVFDAYTAVISRARAAAVYEDNDATWTYGGGAKPARTTPRRDLNSGDGMQSWGANGHWMEWAVPAGRKGHVAIGVTCLGDANGSDIEVFIDGVSQGTHWTKGRPAAQTDGGIYYRIFRHKFNDDNAHTIRLVRTGVQGVGNFLDSAWIEAADPGLVIVPLPHRPYSYGLWTGFPFGPNHGSSPMGDDAIASARTLTEAVVAQFDDNVITVDIDDPQDGGPPGLQKRLDIAIADQVHLNDLGHQIVADRVLWTLDQKYDFRRLRKVSPLRHPYYIDAVYGGGGAAGVMKNNWKNLNSGPNPNGSRGSNPVGFRKDRNGQVHLKGWAGGGTAGQTIFTLPRGYRPPADSNYPASGSLSAYAAGVVRVSANGDVALNIPANVTDFVVLDGVSFPAAS